MDSQRLVHVRCAKAQHMRDAVEVEGNDSMDNPLMKKDLADSILELRNEVERRLMRNKYYVAIKKLDDLLEAIRPLEAEVIDEGAAHRTERAALTSQPVLESPATVTPESVSEEIFAGPTQPQVDPADTIHHQDVFQTAHPETEVPAAAPQPAVATPVEHPAAAAPNMPESLGNVYPAAAAQQTVAQPAQPVEEVFPAGTPQQHGFEQPANPADQAQNRQQPTDAVFTPRHSAAE